MDLGLKDRLAVITGGSQGLGRAVAESFAREGGRLALVARDAAALAQARDAIAAATGVRAETLALDMGQPGAAAAIAAAYPTADVLVNNAGGIVHGDILAVDEARWRAAWESKVFGYINATREFYRLMAARGRGAIVSIIGIGAEKLDHEYAAGATGNAALAAFTRTVGGASLDRGVRVVGIHPGWVDTARTRRFLDQQALAQFGDASRWRDVMATWPLQRLVEPREVADMAVFLASDRASAISGTIVTIDQGLSARGYPGARHAMPPAAGAGA